MKTLCYLPVLAGLVSMSSVASAQTVGAYWTFQLEQNTSISATYDEGVSFSSLSGVAPVFSRTGSAFTNFANFFADFVAFDDTTWDPGRCATWNASPEGGSKGNSFQITFDSTGAEDFQLRFKYRNNGTQSGGVPIVAFSAFDYSLGASFQPVPGIDLTLTNDQNYNNEWSADLSALSAIENSGMVTLRWSLPDFDQGASKQLRVDDLQIIGTSGAPPGPGRTRYLPKGDYNVLFFAFDDLKANFGPFATPELAQAMPRPLTPNLDSLASMGMSFTRAYCQQAVCWASRISVMTGCRPDTTKIWDDGPNFRDTMPGVISLPQHFAARGYNVAGYGKIYDFRSTPPQQDAALSWPQGFSSPSVSNTNSGESHHFYQDGQWQAEQAEPGGSSTRRRLFSTDAGDTNFWATPNRPVDPDVDYSDGRIAGAGISKLNQFATNYLNNGKRFFLAVGLQKPHLPFTSPKSFWDLYDPAEINLAGYDGSRTPPTGGLAFTNATYEIGSYEDLDTTVAEADARRLIHGYLATTSFADYQFGRILAALQKSGVADNTIIVVWGDHGFHLGDHNGYWTKHTCFENATRSPLIIRAPGMDGLATAGEVCSTPVELVDLFPTLVDLAGIAEPSQPVGLEAQGVSLRPLLEDPRQPWKKAAFSQYQRFIRGTGNPSGNGMGYTLRTDRYRYTEWWRTQTSNQAGGGFTDRDQKLFESPEFVELYDHLNDPREEQNLADIPIDPTYADLIAELSFMLAGGNGWDTPAVVAPTLYPVGYETWRSAHATPGIDPLADLDTDADPDFDGIVNLLEYKMGRHPLVPDLDSVISSIFEEDGVDYLALDYQSVPSRSDVTMVGERSSTLLPGSFTTTGVKTNTHSSVAGKELRRSHVAVTPAGRNFLRLKAASD